jgi:hypothetical protein
MPKDRPLPPRPTSKGHIALARAVCIGAGCMSGAAIALGTVPDALASGGLNIVLPVMLSVVVAFGLSAAWHKLCGYAAHAREGHERAIALGLACGAALIGLSLSGWFLASILGGVPAENDYRLGYVEKLRMAGDAIAENAAIEHRIIDALNTAAANIEATASTDDATGLVSGRRGKSRVVLSLQNDARGMSAMSANLVDQQMQQAAALTRAHDALGDATRNAADNDAAVFQDNATRAATETRAAAKIQLGASSLNIGVSAPPAAQHVIDDATAKLAEVIEDVNARRNRVTVPDFQPVDTKTAIQKAPQPLAILAAVAVELIPLLCLALLLTIWRDEETPSEGADSDAVVPFERPRFREPAE